MRPGCAKFLDQRGELKPGDMRASQVNFDRKSEHMGETYWSLECIGYSCPLLLIYCCFTATVVTIVSPDCNVCLILTRTHWYEYKQLEWNC